MIHNSGSIGQSSEVEEHRPILRNRVQLMLRSELDDLFLPTIFRILPGVPGRLGRSFRSGMDTLP